MRVGLFGGTFSPPHLGHRVIAEQAVSHLNLDRLIWMPARRSPHKSGSGEVAAHHRLNMVSLASANHQAFAVSDWEMMRPPPSYTVDTLRHFTEQHPGWELVLLVGGDSWESFERWKEPETIADLAEIAVYPRGNDPVERQDRAATLIPAPRLDVSSTLIRSRIADGGPLEGLLNPDVAAYIRHNRLYRDA